MNNLFLRKRWVKVALQVLLLLAVYLSIRAYQTRDYARDQAPVIDSEMIDGSRFLLTDSIAQPTLVHFWATWCPVCEFENANIAAVSKDYRVVTIASWSGSSAEVVDYMQQQNLTMPVIVDEDGEWAKLYNIKAVPVSFFINKDGMIEFVEKGYTTEAGLRLRLWWLGRQ